MAAGHGWQNVRPVGPADRRRFEIDRLAPLCDLILAARREPAGSLRWLLGVGTGGLAPCRYESELSVCHLCSRLVVMP